MKRRTVVKIVVLVVVLVPLALLAFLSTRPAARLAVDRLLPVVNKNLNGRITVEDVGGSLLGRLRLLGVALRGPGGEILVEAERVELDYGIRDLLRSRIVIDPLILERPVIRLLKDHPGEPYSLMDVFEGGGESGERGTINLVFRRVEIDDGTVVAVVSRGESVPRNGERAVLDTVRVDNINVALPTVRFAQGPLPTPRTASVDVRAASLRLSNPALVLEELQGHINLQDDSIAVALDTLRLPQTRVSGNGWFVSGGEDPRFDVRVRVAQLTSGDIRGFVTQAELPDNWRMRGNVHAASAAPGAILGEVTDLNVSAAGGTVRGRVAMTVGPDEQWLHSNTRVELENVDLEQLFAAFGIEARLRGQIRGLVAANGGGGGSPEPLVIQADLNVDSLRQGEQRLMEYGLAGAIDGQLIVSGPLDALAFQTALAGDLGRMRLSGTLGVDGEVLRLQGVTGELDGVDLEAVSPRLPATRLFGTLEGSFVHAAGKPQTGNVRFFLDTSVIRGTRLDSAAAVAGLTDGLLTLDSLLVRLPGLMIRGGGSFGLEDRIGEAAVEVRADSLSQLKPFLASWAPRLDTLAPFAGALNLDVTARGGISDYFLEFDLDAENVVAGPGELERTRASGMLEMPEQRVALDATVTGALVGGVELDTLATSVRGRMDSLSWHVHAAMEDEAALTADGFSSILADSTSPRSIALDSLVIERRDATWRLERAASARLRNGSWSFDSIGLLRAPGPGRLTISGDMRDSVILDIQSLSLEDLVSREEDGDDEPTEALPALKGRATYAQGKLSAAMALEGVAGRPLVLEVETGREKGNGVRGRLTVDSFDLGLLGRLVPSLGDMGGRLDGSVEVQGSAEQPQLGGTLEIRGGTALVPGLGVRYREVNGLFRFSGDSVLVGPLGIVAGTGRARVDGLVRLPRLTEPLIDIKAETRSFVMMKREDFVEASASGEVRLTGPFMGATLTGRASVNNGVAHIEEFMRTGIVDLSDPLFAQFVDTTVLIREQLGQSPAEQFIDSLLIDSLDVDLGNDFWMRSADANIQLAGRVRVNKQAGVYFLVGTVTAVRGTYNLTLAPGVTREFTVRPEGTIRFFGDSATQAAMDIEVEHLIETVRGEEIRVIAHLTGTMLEPVMELSSDSRPPLSESEIISYLLFGAPTVQAFLGEGSSQRRSLFEQSVERFVGVLSGEIERAVVDQLGLPVDYFRIKPGEVQTGLSGTELLIGKQVKLFGEPTFLRASPRLCPRQQILSLEQIGVSLEMRFKPEWGVAASLDPVRGCGAIPSGSAAAGVPYQVGFDVFWEKR